MGTLHLGGEDIFHTGFVPGQVQDCNPERVGFEPTGPVSQPNRLAGGCLRPLGHLSNPGPGIQRLETRWRNGKSQTGRLLAFDEVRKDGESVRQGFVGWAIDEVGCDAAMGEGRGGMGSVRMEGFKADDA